MFRKMTLFPICVVAALTACGGGGASSPAAAPAALNNANQTTAAQEATSTAYLPLVGAQTLTGAQTLDEAVLFSIARQQLNLLPSYLAAARSSTTLTGVVQSQTGNCTYGGTVTVSASDADNNNVLSTGDSATLAFNNCGESGVTLTGSLAFHINNLTGAFASTNYSGSFTMTFTDFGVTSSQFSASLSGPLTLTLSESGANTMSESLSTPSLSVSGTYAGASRTRSLTNYSATMNRTPNSTYGYTTSYTLSGAVASSALASQSISFATTTPFVSLASDYYPSSGDMLITGSASTKVRITALSNTQVRLELDANGDGTYEDSTTLNWNTLR